MLLLIFHLHGRSINGGSLCKLRNRLVVAVGASLRFGCQDPAPRRILSRGHPFRITAVHKKILVRSIRCIKNAIRNLRWTAENIEMYFLRGFLLSGMLMSDQRRRSCCTLYRMASTTITVRAIKSRDRRTKHKMRLDTWSRNVRASPARRNGFV